MDIDNAARNFSEGGSGSFSGYSLLDYLAIVAACIDERGWISRGNAGPFRPATSEQALMVIDHQYQCKECLNDYLHVTPKEMDIQVAQEALTWIRAMDDSDLSDYLYNLQVVCRSEVVIARHTGLAASLIATYCRVVEEQRSREISAAISAHQGTVGQRTTFDLTVVGCTPHDGMYGVTYFYRLTDAAGNVFTWAASNGQLETGHTYTLKATIKAHSEYRGVAQTVITRAAIVKELVAA
jgi:hypothetical protein